MHALIRTRGPLVVTYLKLVKFHVLQGALEILP